MSGHRIPQRRGTASVTDEDDWFKSEYDDICERLRRACGADGVVVVFVGGKHGSGASIRMPARAYPHVPSLLRTFADGFEEEYTRRNGPQLLCPGCQGVFVSIEAAMPPNRPPHAGDFLLCGRCASILCFTEENTARLATTEEIASMPDEERMALVRGRKEIERRKR